MNNTPEISHPVPTPVCSNGDGSPTLYGDQFLPRNDRSAGFRRARLISQHAGEACAPHPDSCGRLAGNWNRLRFARYRNDAGVSIACATWRVIHTDPEHAARIPPELLDEARALRISTCLGLRQQPLATCHFRLRTVIQHSLAGENRVQWAPLPHHKAVLIT